MEQTQYAPISYEDAELLAKHLADAQTENARLRDHNEKLLRAAEEQGDWKRRYEILKTRTEDYERQLYLVSALVETLKSNVRSL